jgi:hypothetical protein
MVLYVLDASYGNPFVNISRGRVFCKETAVTVSWMAPRLFIIPFWILPPDDTSNDAFIQITFVAGRPIFFSQLFAVALLYGCTICLFSDVSIIDI